MPLIFYVFCVLGPKTIDINNLNTSPSGVVFMLSALFLLCRALVLE
jgi:hypothetical protein